MADWLLKGSAADDLGEADVALSDRERAVVRLVSRGRTNQEIADHLVISTNTVKSTIRTAYSKMGVHTRVEAVLWAVQHGLMPNGDD